MKKRILSLLLVLCLFFSLLPHAVFAADELAGGTFCDGLTWSLDSEGTLMISGMGEMNEAPWLDYSDSIINVVITDGITNIPERSFDCCVNLQSVSIPDSVISISYEAFGSCVSLTEVTIPDSVTEIMPGAFVWCTNLRSIRLPKNLDVISRSLFFECYSLESIEIPELVTEIGESAFQGCAALTSIALPESMTAIGENAFSGCTALTSVVIHQGVTQISERAFYQCRSLTSVNIPETITQIEAEVFSGCCSLDSIDLPDSVTAICANAFASSGIKQITLPDGLRTIGFGVFQNCELKRIVIPDSVTNIGGDAFSWSNLQQIVFEGSAPFIEEYAFRYIYPTIFYPSDDATWNEETKLSYGGSPTWTDLSVDSIEMEDLTVVQGAKGYEKTDYISATGEYSNPYFHYEYDSDITVTLADGTVYQGYSDWVYFDGFSVEMVYDDGQNYKMPWGVGSHEVTAYLGQAQTTFTVTVTENPVERIEVEPLVLYERCAGYWDGYWDDEQGEWIDDTWYRYRTNPETITVIYKDGTKRIYDTDEIEWLTGYSVSSSDDQDYSNQWGVGTHTATAEYMGVTCEYQVVIVENPISGIELVGASDRTTFLVGEMIDLKGAVLRVHFSDGTYEDVEIERSTAYLASYECKYPIRKTGMESNVILSDRFIGTAGTHEVEVRFAGYACKVHVEITESTITEIAIQSTNDRQMRIIATHDDGTVQYFDVTWLEDCLGDGTEEYVMVGGNLSTDQGVFDGVFYQMTDGSVYLEANLGPGGSALCSNTLSQCGWLGTWERIQDYFESILCLNSSGDSFAGELTAENIDKLIEIIRCYDSNYKSFRDDELSLDFNLKEHSFIYDGEEIRMALETIFGLENADLSLSSNYDPATDTYAAIGEGWGSGPYEVPPVFEQKDGLWQITVTNCENTNLRMMLDDDCKIKAYYLYDADHTHAYTETVTAPTCTEGGYTTYACTCGESYTDNSTDPLGHDPQNGVCTRCGEQTGPLASGCTGDLEWVLEWDGILTIRGNGAMKNYTYKSEMPWYSWLDQITTVVLEEGVTAIGDYAFYGMPNLKTITIPQTVTSIGSYAFKNSTALETAVLPGGLTKLGESAFYGCASLAAVEIPATLWTVQPYTFKNCTALAQVTFHEGNLQKISDGAFYNTALTAVELPDCLDILDVYAFKNCAALESVTLGSGLTEIREAVFYGTAIDTLEMPEGIARIAPYAFKNCTALEYVTLPESLTSVGEAGFYACTSLKNLILPDAVRTIGNYAFRKCAALRTVVFPEKLVTIGESSFYGCTALTKLAIPDQVSAIGAYAFKGCTAVASVSLPDALVIIGDSAFHSCTGLKTIVIPAKVTAIGEYCFSGSYNLWQIIFQGDAPAIGIGAFKSMVATAYYPSDNATWTADVTQNYGGAITWKAK